MQVIFIRHGEASSNTTPLEGTVGGYADLTPEGRRQISRTASVLGKFITSRVVWASPFPRTIQSAEIIARQLDLEIVVEERLKEIDKGSWQGRPVREVVELEAAVDIDKRHVFRPPGGENWQDVGERVGSLIHDLQVSEVPQAVLVSHDHPIRMAIGLLLKRQVETWEDMAIDNASITILHQQGEVWRLDPEFTNRTPAGFAGGTSGATSSTT